MKEATGEGSCSCEVGLSTPQHPPRADRQRRREPAFRTGISVNLITDPVVGENKGIKTVGGLYDLRPGRIAAGWNTD